VGTQMGAVRFFGDELRMIYQITGRDPFRSSDLTPHIPPARLGKMIRQLHIRGFIEKHGQEYCPRRRGNVRVWRIAPEVCRRIQEGTI